jgi:DNA-binding protein HU-beta
MRKQELVKAVAQKLGKSEGEASNAVNAVFGVISDSLADGKDVTVSGFGSFKVVERSAREGRNPQTGAAMTIAAKKAPVFRAGTQLKRTVEGES